MAVERAVRRRWRDRRVGARVNPVDGAADVILAQPMADRDAGEAARLTARVALDVVSRYRAMRGEPAETVPDVTAVGQTDPREEAVDVDDVLGCLTPRRPSPATADAAYVDSVWWALSELWDAGLLHEVRPHEPWCPTCVCWHPRTRRRTTPAVQTVVWVRFPVTGQGALHRTGASLAVRATTPWLVPAATAVALDPTADHVLAQAVDDDYPVVIDRASVADVLGPDATIHRPVDAGELDRLALRHPLRGSTAGGASLARDLVVLDACPAPHASAMLAPAFDPAARAVVQRHGVAEVDPIDPRGRYSVAAGPCAGTAAGDGDDVVVAALRDRGLLLRRGTCDAAQAPGDDASAGPSDDAAPGPGNDAAPVVCTACATTVVHRTRPAWRIATSRVRERLVAARAAVGGSSRPHGVRGLDGAGDWTITREEPLGGPLPLWRCDTCAAVVAVDGRARLAALTDPRAVTDGAVADAWFACPTCAHGVARRIPLWLDPLLEAAAVPFARFGFPHEPGSDALVARRCHAAVLVETDAAGWADAVLALALLLWDAPTHDAVVGFDGSATEPTAEVMSLAAAHGADALRWAAVAAPAIWASDTEPLRQAERMVATVLDAAADLATDAARAGWNALDALRDPPVVDCTERDDRDVAVLGDLAVTVARVRQRLDAFDVRGAADALQHFVDRLGSWREGRGGSPDDDGVHARLATFHECLVTLAALLAPFAPFASDEVYERLVRADDPRAPDSVHLLRFPTPDPVALQHGTAVERAAPSVHARPLDNRSVAARTAAS